MRETIKGKTTDEWLAWLEDKDFCIAKVNSKTEAVEQITRENPEALAWVEFPRVGRLKESRSIRLGDDIWVEEDRAPVAPAE